MNNSDQPIYIDYAMQSCDVKTYQSTTDRFCGNDRTLLSKKSLKSFLQSVKYCADQVDNVVHRIAIFDDNCTEDLRAFRAKCIEQFSSDSIKIQVINLPGQPTPFQGIRESIRECYLWLQEHGEDLVYQIQDDYMFDKAAIYEMVDVWQQMFQETDSHAVISPWNDPDLWAATAPDGYRNRASQRTVVPGKHRYWIQYYDCSCSFLTSHKQFSQHWDLYNDFFYLIDKIDKTDGLLEQRSLNYMFVKRGILGLVPINSLAWHMQQIDDRDPYIPWEPIWDAIDVT